MENLFETELFKTYRSGRTFFIDLKRPHLVHSTSQLRGGFQTEVRRLCNVQTCEGKHHDAIASQPLHLRSEKQVFEDLAKEMRWPADETVFMGTAANMNYTQTHREQWQDLIVHAMVTAGVHSNATRAGDPAKYYEKDGQWHPCTPPDGTINILLHIHSEISPAAMARAAMTLTEAKTAALLDLGVGSLSSPTLATGTGTDQFAIAAPYQTGQTPISWAGAHTKLGELIGTSVYEATKAALQWQNGYDAKRCRSLFHQLRRFGLKSEDWISWLSPYLTEAQIPFFKSNQLAIEHDLSVACCVGSLTQLLDQARCGHITQDRLHEQTRWLCAMMVAQVAGRSEQFDTYLQQLPLGKDFKVTLAKALILAWREKWA